MTWSKLLSILVLGSFYHKTRALGELVSGGPLYTAISLPDVATCPGLNRESGLEDKAMRMLQPETIDWVSSAKVVMLLTGWHPLISRTRKKFNL